MLGLSTPTTLDPPSVQSQTAGTNAPSAEGETPTSVADAITETRAERDRLAAELRATEPNSPGRDELAAELAGTEQALQILERTKQFSDADGSFKSGVRWLDDTLVKKWQENPGLMLYKLQANAYKFSWLLIPISIPFVWLLFAWKRQYTAYDHAIFVTYSLSFMTLLFIAASVLGVAGLHIALVATLLTLVPPVHIYKQLRHTYGMSRVSAFWRLLVLSSFIWLVIALFVQTLLMLGAF